VSTQLRRALVAELEAQIELSPAVRDAFLAVPRERFLPGRPLEEVYRNDAIVTKTGDRGIPTSSSSQPTIMALMLEALRLAPGMRVLEIGAGTGYNAAILQRIVGPAGRVVSVDIDPATAAEARNRLGGRVEVIAGDGREGWPAAAPYDRIVVTASATTVYRAWCEQLVDRGLVEVPLRFGAGVQPVATLRREGTRLVSTRVLCGGFMSMRDASGAALAGAVDVVSLHGAGPPLLLFGGALRRMDEAARRRLIGLLLGEPRVRTPLSDDPYWSLGLYLSLTIPETRLLELSPAGIGVVTGGGAGVAVVAPGEARGGRPRARELRAYGDPAAEEELRRRIDHWRRLGCPAEDELALTVDFADGTPRMRRRWRRGRFSARTALR
jgi:protein-L-isoaspartate(D-aspartate) O-methyltransferase